MTTWLSCLWLPLACCQAAEPSEAQQQAVEQLRRFATNIHPDDIAATLYHAVGLDPRAEYHSPTGRPVMLAPQGRVLPV